MTRKRDPTGKGDAFGDWARWAAAPYCAFKDDRIRLFALIARDIRRVVIVAAITLTGVGAY